MPRFPQRFVLSGVACALLVAVSLVAWALATGSSGAQSGTMHNCPAGGKWSIAVWEGRAARRRPMRWPPAGWARWTPPIP